MTNNPGSVVVGLGGAVKTATGAAAAIELGAWEAARRHVDLHLVYGLAAAPPLPLPDTAGGSARHVTQRMLDHAVARTVAAFPALTVAGVIYPGSAASAMVAASATASLVLVCADARVHYGGLLAGLVSLQVATHACAPVIVVSTPRSEPLVPPTPLIVVGIDGSPGSADAVEFAFDEAHARGARLHAVHAFDLPPGEPGDTDTRQTAATEMLRAATDSWERKYPDVPVTHQPIRNANPVRALSNASAGASLIVVGPRGQGGFASLLLGSVSDGLVRYAPTNVAVVRPARLSGGVFAE